MIQGQQNVKYFKFLRNLPSYVFPLMITNLFIHLWIS